MRNEMFKFLCERIAEFKDAETRIVGYELFNKQFILYYNEHNDDLATMQDQYAILSECCTLTDRQEKILSDLFAKLR